jgi:hypothetical protein
MSGRNRAASLDNVIDVQMARLRQSDLDGAHD